MAQRRYLIAANWKMNGDKSLVSAMQSALRTNDHSHDRIEVLVCPPLSLLADFDHSDDGLQIGGQNMSQFTSGAYTGEVSAAMLVDAGCQYVIVGHSERRELFGETNAIVAQKFVAAAEHGLRPILCIGETLEQRQQGVTEPQLAEQLDAVISLTQAHHWQHAVIAYEPVWAIGTGETATPQQAQTVHEFIRRSVSQQTATAAIADTIRIVYGGSMKPDNAASLLAQHDIDGGLIGGASLQPQDFTAIINAVTES